MGAEAARGRVGGPRRLRFDPVSQRWDNRRTASFVYSGAAQTWIVPAGVFVVDYELFGAQGGGTGGGGARVAGSLPVIPGETLTIFVGGQGTASTTPGIGTGAYHHRLVATTCQGCPAGTSAGEDRTFTTAGTAPSAASNPPADDPGSVSGSFAPTTAAFKRTAKGFAFQTSAAGSHPAATARR